MVLLKYEYCCCGRDVMILKHSSMKATLTTLLPVCDFVTLCAIGTAMIPIPQLQ